MKVTAVLLISVLGLGCQMTRLDDDGSMLVMSWGDVKVAACGKAAGEVIREASMEDDGVIPPVPTPECLVIHEGGMSAIMGETLGTLFNAALAVLGRALP